MVLNFLCYCQVNHSVCKMLKTILTNTLYSGQNSNNGSNVGNATSKAGAYGGSELGSMLGGAVGPPIIGGIIGNLVGEKVGEKAVKETGNSFSLSHICIMLKILLIERNIGKLLLYHP